MEGYYVVMCMVPDGLGGNVSEEYSGKQWPLDKVLEAQEELWDAQHDGNVSDPYLKEVIWA